MTYFDELRNKYQRYVNRLIDSRKDRESPKKASDSSNQSTPTKCSPVSCAPSTSPDVINTTPQSSNKQQQIKLNDKSPKTNANGKSLKLVDVSHSKSTERSQIETVCSAVKTKSKEKEKEKEKDKEKAREKDTSKSTAGASNGKNKTQQNHVAKKDVISVKDSEKQKSPAKPDGLVKQKLIDEAAKSTDSATKSNKRRSQHQKIAENEPNASSAVESETKTKLSNSSNCVEIKASPVAEHKTDALIASKLTKPSKKLPTNTVKTKAQRSSSPKQQKVPTQTPTKQQKSCTFEQAISQVESVGSKTRIQPKRSASTPTPTPIELESQATPTIIPEAVSKPSEATPAVKPTEKFAIAIINGKKIEVPERATLDPKMFHCWVQVSSRLIPKRKLNGSMEVLPSPPVKKRKRCNDNDNDKVEPELQFDANDLLCNNRTPRSILQKNDRPRTPLNSRKRVSFADATPASPPSEDKSEQPKDILENEATVASDKASIEEIETKVVETQKKDELPVQEISRSKKVRACRKLVKEMPVTQIPKIIEEPSAEIPAASLSPTLPLQPSLVINELNVVPVIENTDTATTSDSVTTTAAEVTEMLTTAEVVTTTVPTTMPVDVPEVECNENSDEIVVNATVPTEAVVDDNIAAEETVTTNQENQSMITTYTDDGLERTEESTRKRRKPYTRIKPTIAPKKLIVKSVKIKEKHVTKRHRKQADKFRKTKIANTEAKGDIEIVNLEEIKRNVVLDNVVKSRPIPLKPVDETDEDEVKLLVEADPLAIESECACDSPVRTPLLTPVTTPAPSAISMPARLDKTPETPKSMTSAQVIRSQENPLKIKISNGKVVPSEYTPPQLSPSKDSNHVQSSAKLIGRCRTKRIRKKKALSPNFVDDNSSSSESEYAAPVDRTLTPSIERKKRSKAAQPSKCSKENESMQLMPSINVGEFNGSVDQTPAQPSSHFDDRVFRAYVLLDKTIQQIDSENLEVSNVGQIPNLHSQLEPVSYIHTTQAISQASVGLPQLDSMNELNENNSGCVTAVIHNNVIGNVASVGNMNGSENENEPHSMNIIQNYTNGALTNDAMFEMQETICENVESPTMPIVQTDNAGAIIGFESPATVDSTTSGYSSATATSSVYLVDTHSLNHSIEMGNGYNTDFNMQLESFPFVEIQTSDIIDILGKTNDCGDSLSMENISLDNTNSAGDTRTYYLTDEHSLNTLNTINTINTVATMTQATLPTLTTGNILGVFRTKAALKQIDTPPMHLLHDGHAQIHQHGHMPAHLHPHIQVHGLGHGSGIPNDISAKMLRTDNPILNAVISSNEESSIEMQDASESFTMTVDSMVTSSDTVQAANQRRPGLNVIFSTPSKRNNVYLSNENVSIDDFISESHQSLLNPDNFPTTTTSEEPHLDFYTLGI